MSDEIRREMTGLLAAQVESYAEALEQRDLARDVAVQLEGECSLLEAERDAALLRAERAERAEAAVWNAVGFNGAPETHAYRQGREDEPGDWKRGARHVAVMVREALSDGFA